MSIYLMSNKGSELEKL